MLEVPVAHFWPCMKLLVVGDDGNEFGSGEIEKENARWLSVFNQNEIDQEGKRLVRIGDSSEEVKPIAGWVVGSG